MQLDGIREDQVTQVRGFADQRLRKKGDPLDSANRRISLIVQYLDKPEPPATPDANGKADENKMGEKSLERPNENTAEAPVEEKKRK
jgi:chemotaxis protein MotB